MTRNLALVFCSSLALLASPAEATTWTDTEVDDPIQPGAKCQVAEPMSYGGYIYQWPSKYDQVFWPLTDSNGLWFCKESGFIAFIGDFQGLTADEESKISGYLSKAYQGGAKEVLVPEKLLLLEGVYALRDKDAVFRTRLLRVLAYWYESSIQDFELSRQYRTKALSRIEEALSGELDPQTRLEYLYVAANYKREFGDPKASDHDLALLGELAKSVTDEKLKGYADYLMELAQQTPSITPGGKLAPDGE